MNNRNALAWEKIKNGFSGFEKLAFEYVENNFKMDSWNQTKATRDGNRDACAVVIGYRSQCFGQEQWWMEAKYSNKSISLSRYRLDATIVSAILEKNVSKIIFVTNITIKPKVIHDLRNALMLATGYDSIHFVTKYDLEYWLSRNPDILADYFEADDRNFALPELFLVSRAEFYGYSSKTLVFQEPLKILKKGVSYIAHFSLYSNKKIEAKLRPNSNLKGIHIISPRIVMLQTGENHITVCFELKDDFPGKNEKDYDGTPFFIVNACPIISENLLLVYENIYREINLNSQNQIICKIKHHINKFVQKGIFSSYAIIGESGTGKSHIISKAMQFKKNYGVSVYFYEFTMSSVENIGALLNIVLYILFPYICPEDIDITYLKEINPQKYISKFIKKLLEQRDDFEKLLKLLNTPYVSDDIFPVELQINRRIIILDDVAKLHPTSMHFLFNIVQSLYMRNAPVLFIFSDQYNEKSSLLRLMKGKIPCISSVCKISSDEIMDNLISLNLFPFSKRNINIELLFPNIIILLEFSEYLKQLNSTINKIEDFYLAYHSFINTDIAQIRIIEQFDKVFHKNENAKYYCDLIYWREEGYEDANPTSTSLSCINKLLSSNLVKYNGDGKIVPYHDIYSFYYRQYYKLDKMEIISNDFEIYRLLLQKSFLTKQQFDYCHDKLRKLIVQHQFYTVNYILEGLFCYENSTFSKNRLGNERYYELYIIFAISSTNISKKVAGKELFGKISNETRNSSNIRLLKVNEESTWELINSFYDSLMFDECYKNIRFLKATLNKLSLYGGIHKQVNSYIRYHDIAAIETLMEADLNMKNHYLHFQEKLSLMEKMNFEYRALTFSVRYAQVILRTLPDKAIKLFEMAKNKIKMYYGKTDKYYLWASFDYYYMKIAYNSDWSVFPKLLDIHKKMKDNFYNDYRKRFSAFASLFLKQGDIVEAEKYIFADAYVERKLRFRQEAFHYEMLALIEALNDKVLNAKKMLNAAVNIFSGFDSYIDIIHHNIELLSMGLFSVENIQFCFDNQLQKGIYYLDPRCLC